MTISDRSLFNAKAILGQEKQWYYLTDSWEDKGVHNVLNGLIVYVKARLKFEHADYDISVQLPSFM